MIELSTSLRLPVTVEEIDRAWLEKALNARFPGVSISNADVLTVIEGTSTKIRVRLETNRPDIPETLIVKGGFESHSPKLADMYRNEAMFYAAVQPHLTMESPRCFFAGSDPNSHQSIVVIEDMDAAKVAWLDPLVPLDFDAIADRLRVMARYHSQSWESPHFEEGGIWAWVSARFGGWAMDYAERYLRPDVWAHYVKSPRGAAISSVFHDGDWMRGAFRRFAQIEDAGPCCLIHGDTHLGNLYRTANGEPGFLDAQVSRTHWSFEVAYHIVCACDLADRLRWEMALLQVYRDAMIANGIAMPSFDETSTAYARAIGYGLFVFLINQIQFQTEAVNTAYAARFGAAALHHNIKELLR
jgi:hypothetical protein